MSPKLGFLHLPLQLRQQIYEYVGVSSRAIDLNWSRGNVFLPKEANDDIEEVEKLRCWHDSCEIIVKREEYLTLKEYWEFDFEQRGLRRHHWDPNCDQEECFASCSGFALLFTCKTNFLELWESVYRENRFLLDRSGPGGFQRLTKLSGDSIRALTHLTIRLDGEPAKSVDMSDHWTRTSGLLEMKHYSRYGKNAYKEWNALIAHLRDCFIPPGQLNLFLITSVTSLEEAKLIVQPLMSLPTLKGCGIWLNRKQFPELNALLMDTVQALITPKKVEVKDKEDVLPFRYLDLPQEIRSKILSFSDLCASPDVEWKPTSFLLDRIAPLRKPSCDCSRDLGHIDKDLHFDGCKQETHVVAREPGNRLEKEYDFKKHCCVCPRYNHPFGDYNDCKVNNNPYMCIFDCQEHSSYLQAFQKPAWKPYCHPLFLVSQQVRHDAIPIFFQNRQFVITARESLALRHLKRHYRYLFQVHVLPAALPRTELSLFLSSVPKAALRHIRRLEWLLPAPESYRRLPQTVYSDYLDTIEMMIRAMTLANLTLVINMRPSRLRRPNVDFDKYSFEWPSRNEDDSAFYSTLLNPLCLLGEHGLKRCWVYLRLIFDVSDRRYYRDEDEKTWEQKIVGDKTYNAYEDGKPWQERVERALEIYPSGPFSYSTYLSSG